MRAGTSGGERGRETRRSAAHHQHVAMGVRVVIGIGIGRGRRTAEPGHPAQERLVDAIPKPLRPQEGLVVEARHEDRGQQAIHGAEIQAQARPPIDAARDQIVVELDLGRAQIGLGVGAKSQLHQGRRVLRALPHDPAGPMVLEAAPDQRDAVGKQRGGQRITGKSLIAAAIEGEAQRLRAVDAPARGQSRPAHR